MTTQRYRGSDSLHFFVVCVTLLLLCLATKLLCDACKWGLQ